MNGTDAGTPSKELNFTPEAFEVTVESAPARTREEEMTRIETIAREMDLADNQRVRREKLDKICMMYAQTDIGNADRMVSRYGDDIRYCYPLKRWYIWNGKKWEEDQQNRILEMAKDVAIRIGYEAANLGDERARIGLFAWAAKSQAHPRINAMIALASSKVPAGPQDFDAKPNLLNFPNGTLELDTLTFREHRREDMLSMCMGADYIPGTTCPNWIKQVNLVFQNNQEKVEFFQNFAGYHFHEGHPMQCMMIHHGGGQNGRSVLFSVLEAAFGDYSGPFPTELLLYHRDKTSNPRPQPELLDAVKKRFLVAKEVDAGKALSEASIKVWTGGDRQRARLLHDNRMQDFRGNLKINLLTNHMPRMRGTDDGIKRRIVKVPYFYKIPEETRRPVDEVVADLIAELPGIIQWMLNGYDRVCKTTNKSIPLIAAVTEATQEYQAREDVFGRFLDDVCIIDKKIPPCDCIRPTTAVDQFNAWADREGELQMRPGRVKEEMEKRFGKSIKDRDIRYYAGVRLKTEKDLQSVILKPKPESKTQLPQETQQLSQEISGTTWDNIVTTEGQGGTLIAYTSPCTRNESISCRSVPCCPPDVQMLSPDVVRRENVVPTSPHQKEQKEHFVLVRIIHDLDSFVGDDGETYECKKNDIITLPKTNADVLIERGAAVPISMIGGGSDDR